MNAVVTRRSLLQASTATLGATMASAGLAALPVTALSAAVPDPFASYHTEILTLHDVINRDGGEPEIDRLMDRWGKIDRLAQAGRPTTLAGALGAVEYARREIHQFRIENLEENGLPLDRTDVLVLHLLDGAIGVLRQLASGGTA